MRRFLKYGVVFFALSGCDNSIVLELPEPEPRVVFNCIGQANNPWIARVSLSQGVLNEAAFQPLNNAQIDLFEDDVFIERMTLDISGDQSFEGSRYNAISAPGPGKKYRVSISSTYPTVTAEFIQPTITAIDTLMIFPLGPNASEENLFDMKFHVQFKDPPGKNYYEVVITGDTGEDPFPFSSQIFPLKFVDPLYKENNSLFFQTIAFEDTYFEGKMAELDFVSYLINYQGSIPYKRFTLYVRRLSSDYYKYLKDTGIQKRNETDPFAQPIQVHNNIMGGYGVFGGFTQSKFTVIGDF